MKKWISAILCLLSILTFSGCEKLTLPVENPAGEKPNEENPVYEKVVNVYTPRNVMGDQQSYALTYKDARSGKVLQYRLFLPTDYDSSKKYPVLLYLHGMGGLGTDNQKHLPTFMKSFTYAGDILKEAIVLAPQCPSGWWYIDGSTYGDEMGNLGAAKHLLDEIVKDFNGDKDRIYVIGQSMGGYATWYMLMRYGDYFAAGVPVCGGTVDGDYLELATLAKIPIWIFHGDADDTISCSASKTMYNRIYSSGKNLVKLTILPGVAHNAGDYVYTDRAMFLWMFSQNRATNQSLDVPMLRVVNQKGETVLTQNDIRAMADCDPMTCEPLVLTLSAQGAENLKKEYEQNKGGVYTLLFKEQKLYDYQIENIPTDGTFRLFNVNFAGEFLGVLEYLKTCI